MIERIAVIAVDAQRLNLCSLQRPDHVVVVDFIRQGVRHDGKVCQRPLRLDRHRPERRIITALRLVRRIVEGALADNVGSPVEQSVDRLQSQIGHAQVIAVWVDQGHRQSSAPVFDYGAALGGQSLTGRGDITGKRALSHRSQCRRVERAA